LWSVSEPTDKSFREFILELDPQRDFAPVTSVFLKFPEPRLGDGAHHPIVRYMLNERFFLDHDDGSDLPRALVGDNGVLRREVKHQAMGVMVYKCFQQLVRDRVIAR